MVMKPEESAAVQALSLHALSCLSLAAMQNEAEDYEDTGALVIEAEQSISESTDILDRHRAS